LYTTRKVEWIAAREEERAEERRQRDERRRTDRARRDEERRQREELRARLLAAFPAWQHSGRIDQQVILHIGPPNSGKTHNALDTLSIANSGWYLAPLRLLAFEIFDRLNQRGIRCNLLTGEEYIPVAGANVTAATIEMFDPTHSGDCVIIDEAQMLADPDRGWAWTRALMEAQAPDIYVIGPPNARDLIERLASAAAIPIQVIEHERLAPIEVAQETWPIEKLPNRTILVAFSRRMVLHLKTELEMRKRSVSVVYGNLPPEVRRRQADRFAAGQTEICVATDAVGMGLNLPADQVCFWELEKFDGKQMRMLTAAEAHQIGGRAGRYGLSKAGRVGATTKRGLKMLERLFATTPQELTHARVAPVVEDLALIPGSLAHRFAQWSELQSIPDSLRNVIRPADIDERIALARMLTDREVDQLGLEAAVKIVNAPTRDFSRDYWRLCTLAILAGESMPHPPEAPFIIENDRQLDQTEQSIACADIYLWLSRRPEFGQYAPDEIRIREMRTEWSMSIDAALLRRLDTLARCVNCHKPLPLGHRYSLCDNCYNQRVNYWY
jgi:ATP-dependent RNA helicase SUPV3L1/SUV3